MPETATFDHYEVLTRADGSLHELGRGAMGVTYKAFDTRLLYPVCLRVINPIHLKSEASRQRFIREARLAAKLRHRNVASVFHLGTEGNEWYYAMEFIDGETLDETVKHDGPLGPRMALEIAAQVARALNAAAQRGLVHRAIKPAKVMLVPEDDEVVAKVIDFGLTKAPAEGEEEVTVSMTGFIGTVQFSSPEQLEEKDVDVRSDIYSLGATLWYTLAGQPPFRGPLALVMHQQLTQPPPFDELATLPPGLKDLLGKMLQKNPADRFQTPLALRKAIDDLLDRLPAAPAFATSAPALKQNLGAPFAPPARAPVSIEQASSVPTSAKTDEGHGFLPGTPDEQKPGPAIPVIEDKKAAVPPPVSAEPKAAPSIIVSEARKAALPPPIPAEPKLAPPIVVGEARKAALPPPVPAEPKPAPSIVVSEVRKAALPPPVPAEPKPAPSIVVGEVRKAALPPPVPAEPKPAPSIVVSEARKAAAAPPVPAEPRPAPSIIVSEARKSALPPPPPVRPAPRRRPAPVPQKSGMPAPVIAVAAAILVIGAGGYLMVRGLGKPKLTDNAPTPSPTSKITPNPAKAPTPVPAHDLAQASTPTPMPTRKPVSGPTPMPTPALALPDATERLSLAVRAAEKLEDQGDSRAALASYMRLMKDFPGAGSIPGRNHMETLLERLRQSGTSMTTEQFESMQDLIAEAAQKNVLSAMLIMGQRLRKKSPGESYEWFKKAADVGDAAACDYIGNMLVKGVPGVVQADLKKAEAYLQRAAEKGSARSKAALGQYYLEGLGGTKEDDLGVGLLREAAAGGDPRAMNILGDYLVKKAIKRPRKERKAAAAEYEEAFRLFTESKDSGDQKALANLGLLYMRGVTPGSRGPDYEKAVALFAQGAKDSDPLAMYSYARCLEDGLGIKKDLVEARRWDLKAAQSADKDFIKWSIAHKINLTGKPEP